MTIQNEWQSTIQLKEKQEIVHTLESISLSHRSLIIQPAPLIKKAPAPNKVSKVRSGKLPGADANERLQ